MSETGYHKLEKALGDAFFKEEELTREEIKEVILTTPGVPYPAGTTSQSVFELLVAADFLEDAGENKYRYNPSHS